MSSTRVLAALVLALGDSTEVLAPAAPSVLRELHAVALASDLGPVAPLVARTSAEVARASVARRALRGGAPLVVANGAAELEPLAPLTVQEHRARVQGVAAWSAPNASAEAPFAARVAAIRCADELEVASLDTGETRRVTLYGVRAPESDQPRASEARAHTAARLAASSSLVVVPVAGSGDNTAALVLIVEGDGSVEPLGESLLRRGLAWWSERHAGFDGRLRELAFAARDRGLGCYSDPAAVPPDAWELGQRKSEHSGWHFAGEVVRARVEDAIDGDTLRVRVSAADARVLGRETHESDASEALVEVRLAGVDAPEIDQPGGIQAWALAHLACAGEEVELVLLDAIAADRISARAVCRDGELLGEKLVRTGRARAYPLSLPDERLAALEDAARRARAGIWSSPLSVAPGFWRDVHVRTAKLWAFDGVLRSVTVDVGADGRGRSVTVEELKADARGRFDALCADWASAIGG